MRHPRRRHMLPSGERRSYRGKHHTRRRSDVVGPVVAIILGVLGLATLGFFALGGPSSRDKVAPEARPPQRSASIVFAATSFQGGVQGWRAFPGTFFTRGQLGRPGVTYGRIQRDPSTGSAMVGIGILALPTAQPGLRVQATVRVRATHPGITVVVRLSEQKGSRRVEAGEGRLTVPDTGWHQVGADHRVLHPGTSIDLEIWALALGPDEAVFVDRPEVTSP